MAKVTAPLLSLKASGTIGKTQTFASWRGVNYVRERVIPANPRTSGQVATRNVFSYLSAVWKQLNPVCQAPWTLYAKGQPFTDRNAYAMFNNGPMIAATANHPFIGSPGANAGLALISATPTSPSGGVLHIAFVAPTPPNGWTLGSVEVFAIVEADPTVLQSEWVSFYATNTVSPVALTGLTSAATYAWSAWATWTKADNTTAYGASLNGTQLIT